MAAGIPKFWNIEAKDLYGKLASSSNGLAAKEARKRLSDQQKSQNLHKQRFPDARLLLSQFKSPLVLLLVFAVILSIILGEYSDSLIILFILLVTGILGFIQERKAGKAVEKLKELVRNKAAVIRDGKETEVFIEEIVPGDIVLLNAGDIIPADALIVEADDLHVNESVLTGESYPVEKFAGESPAETIAQAKNAVFKGTSVINGTATVLAVNTGSGTELGKIASSLEKSEATTAFEKGTLKFGYLLMRITVVFTAIILVLNIAFHRPFTESLLFSLALTVGFTPELLPAILTVTLAAGAKKMAAKKVIVKRLNSIENLGGIDILCSDKTGTVTEGIVRLEKVAAVDGKENPKIRLYAYLNAFYETGFSNPIDESVRQLKDVNIEGYSKRDEVPYDFIRKRLSIVVESSGSHIMITKGAVSKILEVCTRAEKSDGQTVPVKDAEKELLAQYEDFSSKGYRVIAVSYKDVTTDPVITKDDETDMVFLGFLIFADPLKPDITESIQLLREKGIALKIITGDNIHVARHISRKLNLQTDEILAGSELDKLTAEELGKKIEKVDVFAEILPDQKEQIVKAFQKNGHTVGYLGDGINDANALKAADVGISINNAVDVAKEAADMVLLDRNIEVIRDGVEVGRKTFMNTMKYIFVTTSANFGNMFSMAVSSLLLPFLPLLPVQILLNNLLSDLPAVAIASDKVDDELVASPHKWDMRYIWRFMIVFGLQSSLFDFLTFGVLLYVFHASPEEFRTAWFMESLLTEILILLIIRTKRPFFKSAPSRYLLWATIITFIVCIGIPYLPFAGLFQLYPLPWTLVACNLGIIFLYILIAEVTKKYVLKA